MTPKRPKSLKWIGEMYPDGRPARFLEFVPPRDLTEAETDALDQEQLRIIRQHDDLYKEVHAPEPKRPRTAASRGTQPKTALKGKPPAAVSSTQPEIAGATITGTVGDEPSTAAESASEG